MFNYLYSGALCELICQNTGANIHFELLTRLFSKTQSGAYVTKQRLSILKNKKLRELNSVQLLTIYSLKSTQF